jgi:hypothetical protein
LMKDESGMLVALIKNVGRNAESVMMTVILSKVTCFRKSELRAQMSVMSQSAHFIVTDPFFNY